MMNSSLIRIYCEKSQSVGSSQTDSVSSPQFSFLDLFSDFLQLIAYKVPSPKLGTFTVTNITVGISDSRVSTDFNSVFSSHATIVLLYPCVRKSDKSIGYESSK